MTRLLGVLVAGGRGARLGRDVPKPLVRVGGVPMIERALGVLREVCDELVVSAPPERELPVPAELRVDDPPGFRGGFAGLVAGLTARSYQRAIVLGVDFPLMRPAALAAVAAMITPGELAVVPAPGSIPQPFAAVYSPEAAERLRARLEAGERAVTPAVLALAPRLLVEDELLRLEGGVENFFNVNYPEQLEAAERLLAPPG